MAAAAAAAAKIAFARICFRPFGRTEEDESKSRTRTTASQRRARAKPAMTRTCDEREKQRVKS